MKTRIFQMTDMCPVQMYVGAGTCTDFFLGGVPSNFRSKRKKSLQRSTQILLRSTWISERYAVKVEPYKFTHVQVECQKKNQVALCQVECYIRWSERYVYHISANFFFFLGDFLQKKKQYSLGSFVKYDIPQKCISKNFS